MTLLVKDYTDIELCIEQTMPRGRRPPRCHHRRLRQDLVRAVGGPPWLFRAGRARGARPGLPALFGALLSTCASRAAGSRRLVRVNRTTAVTPLGVFRISRRSHKQQELIVTSAA